MLATDWLLPQPLDPVLSEHFERPLEVLESVLAEAAVVARPELPNVVFQTSPVMSIQIPRQATALEFEVLPPVNHVVDVKVEDGRGSVFELSVRNCAGTRPTRLLVNSDLPERFLVSRLAARGSGLTVTVNIPAGTTLNFVWS